MLKIISKLVDLGPRYGKKEIEAAKLITDELSSLNIPFEEDVFETSVPNIIRAELFADSIKIPCVGSSLFSGEIKSGEFIISAVGYSGKKRPFNISYNPLTDEISVMEFYVEPSVTVSRNSIAQIIMAKEVRGVIEVEKEYFTSKNILVGNSVNPKNIVFAHYDSIVGGGAIDNAGAVAVSLEIIKQNSKLLLDTLFVFSGNEEISYDDYETKSGYGFRIFEEKHAEIIKNSKQIVVIDGIGLGTPLFGQTGLDWVFQIKLLDKVKNKIYWLQNNQGDVLKYFHTSADSFDKLSEDHLEEAKIALLEKIGG
ncbi:MAG: hypothetical protein UR60_C0028G0022 [Candidatus Moranbacteria bacterium GW2011_GWF2_34_56]|nr:MAG: hypothetical protein UR51_C0002G0151 [Candidatus Moranbacteria bacterium GW2011_GWF1_34_10]KKP64142.1 MAG: hypothetical protein UR60_C0028G0022 [Candidatus Moranbacteria bacterium GW2011_GWF2_34_56]HBI17574.1 hypothetical protein [Candidatus Moranbacteria bacterium]